MSKEGLGNVFRLLPIANDLSLSSLSKYSGLSISYICELEKCKKSPSPATIKN